MSPSNTLNYALVYMAFCICVIFNNITVKNKYLSTCLLLTRKSGRRCGPLGGSEGAEASGQRRGLHVRRLRPQRNHAVCQRAKQSITITVMIITITVITSPRDSHFQVVVSTTKRSPRRLRTESCPRCSRRGSRSAPSGPLLGRGPLYGAGRGGAGR